MLRVDARLSTAPASSRTAVFRCPSTADASRPATCVRPEILLGSASQLRPRSRREASQRLRVRDGRLAILRRASAHRAARIEFARCWTAASARPLERGDAQAGWIPAGAWHLSIHPGVHLRAWRFCCDVKLREQAAVLVDRADCNDCSSSASWRGMANHPTNGVRRTCRGCLLLHCGGFLVRFACS